MTPFRLTAFGTFPILRPIFHKMKNAGRVILEECKGQARRTAERSHEQLIYRKHNPQSSPMAMTAPFQGAYKS